MSSRDGNGKFGPGAMSAAEKAKGGAGGVPTPPPRPGAARAVASATQAAAANFAAAGPPQTAAAAAAAAALPAAAPAAPLSDEAARARVARAGLRQFKREYPAGSGVVHTPTGDAIAHKIYERNTQGRPVDYIRTDPAAYPGSTEPKRYEHIAGTITPSAAAAALGSSALSADESMPARRASTTARALADVSEQQRNGGGKHARAALRTVAKGALSPQEVYAGKTPAFPQAKAPGGVQYHRDVMAERAVMTPAFKTVVEHFSDSSDDEQVAALSPREATRQYRLHTETAAVRSTFGAASASAGAAASAASQPDAMRPAPAPRRGRTMPAQARAEDRADAFAASSTGPAAAAAATPAAASSSTHARTARFEARAQLRADAFVARRAAAAPAAAAAADVEMAPADVARGKRPRSPESSKSDAERQRKFPSNSGSSGRPATRK